MSPDTTPVQIVRRIGGEERWEQREKSRNRREDVIYLYFEIIITLSKYFLERHNRALCDWILLLCKG